MARAFTKGHGTAYRSSKKEMARYDKVFKPLVKQARDQAINWDTGQRHQANIDQATNSVRLGIRGLQKGAGADVGDIISTGTATGNIMANTSVQGGQLTGWQKLKKLGNVTAHARHQEGVVESGMMNYGNMESAMNRTSEEIKQALSEQRSQLVGQAVGTGIGMYAGGWWSSQGGSGAPVVDGAGGGVGSGNVGTSNYRNMINGTGSMVV